MLALRSFLFLLFNTLTVIPFAFLSLLILRSRCTCATT